MIQPTTLFSRFLIIDKYFFKNNRKHLQLALLFLAAFIFSSTVTAQLSVRNNAFIYVNDEIVFVEDDINLEESTTAIYLRTEAQVIQGTGTTGNSGEGLLSVYQDGNVGEYEYNYWCSPTGSFDDTTVNNPFGITLLNDIVDVTNSTAANVTHQTGYNGTSNPLAIEPYWIWMYRAGTAYADWEYVGDATTIPAGYGFSMKGTAGTSANNTGDNQNYDFRGKPNTGKIEIPILTNEFTLVGNPYPSAMDAHAYIWDANNRNTFDGVLHYWEQDPDVNSHLLESYDGGYTTYTISEDEVTTTIDPAVFKTYNADGTEKATSGTPITGKIPERYIPIGQGFIIEGGANATINAENSHRVYEKESDGNSAFFKSTNSKTTTTEVSTIFTTMAEGIQRFRLNIDFNNTYTRQIIETFSPNATEGFDRGLEISLHEDNMLSSDAYWQVDEDRFLAEALSYHEDLKIPLTIEVSNSMPINISIADVQNFDTNSSIYIHDIATNIYVDLNIQDFDINLDTGKYTERFEVTFKEDTTLDTEAFDIGNLDATQNNTTDILTLLNPTNLNIKSILVYDVSGKEVLTQTPNTTQNTYTLSTKNLSTGVYIIKATTNTLKTFSKKIIVN
jgi:hypothetical protein